MVNIPSVEEMMKAGMHFGHRTSKWHPKMAPYIFTNRNGVHIINLVKSQQKLEEALAYITKMIGDNKTILFVGTKNQVKDQLKAMAVETGVPFANEKWLAGLMTNFGVIKKMIKKYIDIKEKRASGKLEKYTKKEQLNFEREMGKLERKVGGMEKLDRLPDAIFLWDIKKEETAMKEAIQMKIPIIAVCDTNVNPQHINYIIPSNDDATKTITL